MRLIFFTAIILLISSCSDNDSPDVSGIKVDLTTQRFERDLFSIDTNNIMPGLAKLDKDYPVFNKLFFREIINADPQWPREMTLEYLSGFITAYRQVYDSSENVFNDFDKYEKRIEHAVKYVKHYFPNYKTPEKIITYIGPLDGVGNSLSVNAFIIGLHHHLGKDFSLYKSDYVRTTYPEYISRNFEPGYIEVNCMKSILNDMYPEKPVDQTLVVQMIEKGKRLYVLSKFLPNVDEYMLIGYTEKQLKESYDHEKSIWNLFIQNNLLQTTDFNVIKNYVGESPKTMELGEASPGNIGSFAGWQIVKKYISVKNNVTPQKLMETNPEEIFREAKYKP